MEGCLGGALNWTNIRVHCAHLHTWNTIVILEEGNQPYSRYPQCDMFVSHKTLNGRILTTAFCRRRSKRKGYCLVEEEARAGADTSFTAYGVPLAPVTSFVYLGRVFLVDDDYWPAVVRNLRKARRKW